MAESLDYNKEEIAERLRFRTSASGRHFSSLEVYVARMKTNQRAIYFISGETEGELASSCYIEKLNKLGLEVIYMTNMPNDEFLQLFPLKEYKGKKLVSACEKDLELPEDDEEKSKTEADQVDLEYLCESIKETLGDKVEKVVVSRRLVDSVACIIPPARNDPTYSSTPKTLEINPEHTLIVHAKIKADDEEFDEEFDSFVQMIYREALILSGLTPEYEEDELDQEPSFETEAE